MTERLLQYLWQFQYFNSNELTTEAGEPLTIVYPGLFNANQGPDFLEAKIKVGDTILVGNIELHVCSTDWKKHRHQQDDNYKNVILHVVWKQNDAIMPNISLLVLESRISNHLLLQYQQWMEQKKLIPCASKLFSVKEIIWITWKERLLVERLIRKSDYVLELLQANQFHWEETFWQILARSFGGKVNGTAFEHVARSVPVNVLARHKNQLITLEAILLGQAGLLKGDFDGKYAKLLQREYEFQQHKYEFQQFPAIMVSSLRMRPASFPAVRLAQLAALVHQSTHLFAKVKESNAVHALIELLNVLPNDYWSFHYTIDEPTPVKEKRLGLDMIHALIINAVAPVVFAYGLYHKENKMKERALHWMMELPAEKNSIIKQWKELEVTCSQAYHTQALIELTNEYCTRKRCLECAVGNAILKKEMIR